MRFTDVPKRTYRSLSRALRVTACLWPFENTRQWLYHRLLKKTGRGVVIMPFVYCFYGSSTEIGDGAFINTGVILEDAGGIKIGKGVHIGCRTVIMTTGHKYTESLESIELKPVHVGDNAWIGANVTILPGITVGEGSVIGAGAVVTADVEPYTVVAGVPARKIRTIKMGTSALSCPS